MPRHATKTSFRPGDHVAEKNPRYRHDITATEAIRLCEKGLNCTQIAEYLNCDRGVIHRRLKAAGYRTNRYRYEKSLSAEARERIAKAHRNLPKGRESPHYTTGFGIYRRLGFEEQGKKCAICGTTENLCVHHENGDRKDNRPENLRVLCRQCHFNHHGGWAGNTPA